jgi:hypothetical protein
VLNFVMQSNLTLMANFIPNPFLPVKGTYTGLLANTNGVMPNNSGSFAITTTKSGLFTGRLIIGGARFGFRGQLDLDGNANVSIRRRTLPPLALTLHVDLTNGTDEASGYVTSSDWTAGLVADRNVFGVVRPAQQAGLRGFVLQRTEDETTAATGSSKIGINGLISVRGKLSDGRAFTTRGALAKNGDCPFYLSLNRGSEVVIGWLNFPLDEPSAHGTVLWVKSGTNAFATTLRAMAVPAK